MSRKVGMKLEESLPISSLVPSATHHASQQARTTFRELRRYAANGVAQAQHALKSFHSFDSSEPSSRFYSADTLSETMYTDDHRARQRVPSCVLGLAPADSDEHIYEEIPDVHSNGPRPLPPIPESSLSGNPGVSAAGTHTRRGRHGSIFEGASKYEILHYLRDAKDRLATASFNSETFLNGEDHEHLIVHQHGPMSRNHSHRYE